MGENWFPEPEGRDDRYAGRLESTPSWLARSTLDVGKACRSLLNRNLAALPEECQRGIAQRLNTDQHHRSGFFELVVGRTLQVLGASITCEPENPADGTRIDSVARFPDHDVGIEATSPWSDWEMSDMARNNATLVGTIEDLAPSGWAVAVGSLCPTSVRRTPRGRSRPP